MAPVGANSTPEDVCATAEKLSDLTSGELMKKYGHLNPGQVRMALRGYVNCHDTDHAISMLADVDLDDERLSLIVAAHERALHEIALALISQLS